jgi:short-subunit dehydrogenase
MKGGRHPVAGRRVWVVGASSGIGAAVARELVDRGALVAVSARRKDRLAEVAGDEAVPVPLDVTNPVAARRAAAEVRETLGGLDTVVWSAGYWKHMDPSAWDLETFSRHVDVNLMGMGNVLAATLPGLVEQRHGHVVGVASVAGYRGLPGAEAYGATKAAQILLLESLRGSLSPFGVRVTTVCPGFVRTEMTEVNEFPMPFIVDPEAAGREIVDGIERGAAEVVFPWQMALLMKAARLLPARAWGALTAGIAARRA